MNLLKISNCCFNKGGRCALSLISATQPSIPTTLTSSPCALHALDGQRFSDLLLATHGTKFENAIRHNAEALRAELYETKLRLLATQLAYKELALSAGSGFCPLGAAFHSFPTNLCLNQKDLFDSLRDVQPIVGLRGNQLADPLLCHRFLNDPGDPPTTRTKIPTSDPRQIPLQNAMTPISSSEEAVELAEVKQLMLVAHNGDVSAMDKARSLKRIAELTSKTKRSDAQTFLLEKWGKPPLRELFVDASGQGIAVVLDDGRWLAWKFVSSHADLPKGPDGSVVIVWAELIVVEMGVRTLIATNHSYMSITLRSDNRNVVDALKNRGWKKEPRLDRIVQEIFSLCDEVGFHLQPELIGGKENPADKPTRGKYPSEKPFADRPSIPKHLSGLIQEVECVK